MTQTTHTPGPLHVASTGNHQGLIIEEGTGANIAVVYDKEHAPFIVTACNSHEKLLEALKSLVDEYGEGGMLDNDPVMDKARAAIAEAEAGQ